ncbi:hypothetical protein V6U77_14715 [Micromonospora sp. CPCC 205546]|uniref:hypothetical protein n=1 Tax=Micromonospora sp. CPCC 205546 TaxID=3122397 RepID=UPI002FEF7002
MTAADPTPVRQLFASADIDATTLLASETAEGLPVYGVRIEIAHAAGLWRRLRARHDDTGLRPFLSRYSPTEWAQWRVDAPHDPGRLATALARSPSEVIDELNGTDGAP